MRQIEQILLLLTLIWASTASFSENQAKSPGPRVVEVTQTVLQVPLRKGVSAQDAVEAMISKASELNVKLVSHLRVSDELNNRGLKAPHLEVLQLCSPEDAGKAVALNTIYAAYIPCRIALVEDADGIIWATMQNLDFLVDNKLMPTAAIELAIRINQEMLMILTAGVSGDL